jgi:vacuolar-type H+-ATPase subunit E/Vma4
VTEDKRAKALIEQMRSKAEAERIEIENRAKNAVSEIQHATEAKAAQLKDEAFRALDAELEDFARHARLTAEMKAASARSKLCISMIEEVFEAAAVELDRLIRGEGSLPFSYDDVFSGLLIDAAREVAHHGTMKVCSSDIDLCRETLRSAGIDMSLEVYPGRRGAILAVSADGLRQIDNSIHLRLERARTRLTPLILRALGGGV